MAADEPVGTAAEQDQPVIGAAVGGNATAMGEGPRIGEADVAALEMVLDQAEILRLRVLDDEDRLHRPAASLSRRFRRPP